VNNERLVLMKQVLKMKNFVVSTSLCIGTNLPFEKTKNSQNARIAIYFEG